MTTCPDLTAEFLPGGGVKITVPKSHSAYAGMSAMLARATQREATTSRYAIKMSAAAAEEAKDDVPAEAYKALAEFYAATWSALQDQGEEISDHEMQSASDELSGSGWGLQLDNGKWSAYRVEEDEEPVQMSAGARAPKGYTREHPLIIAGSHFVGGMFIPGDKLAQATPAQRAEIEAHNTAQTKAAGDKRRARGSVDHESLTQRLQPHAEKYNLAAAEHKKILTSAKLMYAALNRHHGELVLHRVDELADLAERALAGLPEGEDVQTRYFTQQLSKLRHVVEMAKAKGHTGKVAKTEPKNEMADFLNKTMDKAGHFIDEKGQRRGGDWFNKELAGKSDAELQQGIEWIRKNGTPAQQRWQGGAILGEQRLRETKKNALPPSAPKPAALPPARSAHEAEAERKAMEGTGDRKRRVGKEPVATQASEKETAGFFAPQTDRPAGLFGPKAGALPQAEPMRSAAQETKPKDLHATISSATAAAEKAGLNVLPRGDSLADQLDALGDVDTDVLDPLDRAGKITHNELFRQLHKAYKDAEANKGRLPGGPEYMDRIAEQSGKIADVLDKEGNGAAAKFYREQGPALAKAIKDHFGRQGESEKVTGPKAGAPAGEQKPSPIDAHTATLQAHAARAGTHDFNPAELKADVAAAGVALSTADLGKMAKKLGLPPGKLGTKKEALAKIVEHLSGKATEENKPSLSPAVKERIVKQSPVGFQKINPVEKDKVDELAKSMRKKGWIGDPLLVMGKTALTGSHRLAAAEKAGLDSVPTIKVNPSEAEEAAKKLKLVDEEGNIFVDNHEDWIRILREMKDDVSADLFQKEIDKAGEPASKPAEASEPPWADDVVKMAEDQEAKNPFARMHLPDVYERLKAKHPDLTIAQFQEGLKHLHGKRRIELGAFTQAKNLIPHPEHAFKVSPEAMDTKYFLGKAQK